MREKHIGVYVTIFALLVGVGIGGVLSLTFTPICEPEHSDYAYRYWKTNYKECIDEISKCNPECCK